MTIEEYADEKDEDGYYKTIDNLTTYITEVPPMIITNKVVVQSEIIADPVTTNEVSIELDDVMFAKETGVAFDRPMNPGAETPFSYTENKGFNEADLWLKIYLVKI